MSLTCSRMEELGEELSRMQEDFRRSFGPELMRRSVSCASSAAPGCSAGEASGPQAEPRRERPPVAQTRPRYTPARRTSSASEKKAVLSAFPPATHATVLKRQGTRRGVPQSPAAPQRAVAGETAAERRGGRTPAAKAGPGGRQGLEAPSAAITPAKPVSASKAPRRQASAPKEAPRMYDFSPAPAGRQPGAQRANVAATPRSAVPTHRRPSKPPQATRTPLWGKAPVRKPAPSNTPAPRPHSVSSRGCVTAKGTPSAAARKLEEDCNVQSSCTGTLARGRASQGGRWGPGCSSYKECIALGSAPLQSGRPSPRTPVFDPDIMAEARELAELMHPSKSEPLQADLPPTLEPSLWELALKQPGVTWDDVPEMASARSEVEAHLLESGAGARCSKSRPCALLLLHEGAGGLAEAAAHGLGAQLMHISPVLMSSSELQGQERELQDSVFTRAFQSPLSVILIDYLDRQPKGKVARELRNALMSDLCLYLEACAEQPNRQTAVLVATSRPETLSSDLLTNLRTKIFIPLPPEHVREDIIFSRLARRSDNAALSVEDIGRLASMTDGWSASDIKEACDRVLSGAGCGRTVSFEDFKAQLMSATPRISSGKAARLESWARSNAGPGPKGEACP
uniref:ATPase AAA-type core domain-containing protein n=1 Tax=Tetraselmis sp. GSL018 TaxID=582737 RepID=A0A061R3U3_9CHLO